MTQDFLPGSLGNPVLGYPIPTHRRPLQRRIHAPGLDMKMHLSSLRHYPGKSADQKKTRQRVSILSRGGASTAASGSSKDE